MDEFTISTPPIHRFTLQFFSRSWFFNLIAQHWGGRGSFFCWKMPKKVRIYRLANDIPHTKHTPYLKTHVSKTRRERRPLVQLLYKSETCFFFKLTLQATATNSTSSSSAQYFRPISAAPENRGGSISWRTGWHPQAGRNFLRRARAGTRRGTGSRHRSGGSFHSTARTQNSVLAILSPTSEKNVTEKSSKSLKRSIRHFCVGEERELTWKVYEYGSQEPMKSKCLCLFQSFRNVHRISPSSHERLPSHGVKKYLKIYH